jgi:hypothetical protein
VPRFFDGFFNSDPMTEISAAEAAAERTHAEEVPGPPLHYLLKARERLVTVAYPGWTCPDEPAAYHRATYPGTRCTVYSPVTRTDRVRWRGWYFDGDGVLTKLLDPEFDERGRMLQQSYRGPDGELRSWSEYVYDHDLDLVEIVTRDPSGQITFREKVEP